MHDSTQPRTTLLYRWRHRIRRPSQAFVDGCAIGDQAHQALHRFGAQSPVIERSGLVPVPSRVGPARVQGRRYPKKDGAGTAVA